MKLYYCIICDTKPDQKSHNDSHIASSKHNDKRQIKMYELKDLDVEVLRTKYKSDDLGDILNKLSSCIIESEDSLINEIENKWYALPLSEIHQLMENNNIPMLTFTTGKNKGQVHDNKKKTLKYCIDYNINNQLEDIKEDNIILNDISTLDDEKYMNFNTNNSDILRNKIHHIHNFLRNNGVGYGMNAFQFFTLFYGLSIIERNNLYNILNIDKEIFSFENLLKIQNGHDLQIKITKICQTIYKDDSLKKMLFILPPRDITDNTLIESLKLVKELIDLEKKSGSHMFGKIYEYFIGRDKQNMKEMGTYYTDRHIVQYIYNKVQPTLEDDGKSVKPMIDMFAGSGGFTLQYISYLQDHYPNIDWSTELKKVYHNDMNSDVIKSAGLEMMGLTRTKPNYVDNIISENAFKNSGIKKFKYIFTNPPYGGDTKKQSLETEKNSKIKIYLEEKIKDKNLDKQKNQSYREQLLYIKRKDKEEDDYFINNVKVNIKSIGYQSRIYKYIDRYNNREDIKNKFQINGSDKEECSLVLIMDMLDIGGTAAAVLKEGTFFNGKYKNLRKAIIENFNVREIISVPSDQFENTSTKTSIIIFDNLGEEKTTTQVKFSEISIEKYTEDKFEEKNGVIQLVEDVEDIKGVVDKVVSTATREEILANPIFSLNGKDYNKQEIVCGEDYELVKLGDICEINPKTKKTYEGTYRLVKIKDIDNHQIINFDEIQNLDVKESNICNYNDIIISHVRPKSRKSLILTKSVIDRLDNVCFTMPSIRIKDYDPFYVYSVLYPLIDTFEKKICTGSSYPTIKLDKILNIKIPIPKTPEKLQYWVDRISTPYEAKNNKLKEIEELEKKVQDRIQEIIDTEECEEKELGEVCSLIDGYDFYKKDLDITYDEGKNLPVIKNGNSTITYANILKKYEKYLSNKNDILICTMGTICIKINIFDRAYHGHHIYRVEIKDNLNQQYLYYYINKIINKIKNLSNGSVVKGISKENLSKIKIPIPTNPEIIKAMDPDFQRIEQLQGEIKEAEELYDRYIQELSDEAIPKHLNTHLNN